MARRRRRPNAWTVTPRSMGGTWRLAWCAPPLGAREKPRTRTIPAAHRNYSAALEWCERYERVLNARLREAPRDPLVIEVYDQAVSAFRQGEHGHSAASLVKYATARPWVALGFAGVRASTLDPESIAEARRRMLAGSVEGRRIRPATARLYMEKVCAAWTWALANRRRTGVVTPWVAPRSPGTRAAKASTASLKAPFTPEHGAAMVRGGAEYVGGLYLPAVLVLHTTGVRRAELCAANVEDLYTDSDGLVYLHLRPENTKTGRGREVPILAHVLDALRLEGRTRGPLFLGRRGGRLKVGVLQQSVHRILELAGLAAGVAGGRGFVASYVYSTHSFRRAWITDAQRAGVDPLTARAIVGHKPRGVHDGYTERATLHGSALHAACMVVEAYRRETSVLTGSLSGGDAGHKSRNPVRGLPLNSRENYTCRSRTKQRGVAEGRATAGIAGGYPGPGSLSGSLIPRGGPLNPSRLVDPRDPVLGHALLEVLASPITLAWIGGAS